ncbi:hypothetical protein FGB62_110g06 [Gracilaria domingensis]|nr:hypothetical protein FGB62_110g06 [Gracilaria domingensis]
MASVRKEEPQGARQKPALQQNTTTNDHEQELEEEDPVMNYLMNKKQEEPFDHCLWFSRGMHHVRMPGEQLHTAVQDAEKDEYIAVLGHNGKWKWLFHRVRRVLSRAAPGPKTMMTYGNRGELAVNGRVPHAHLCIIKREKGRPKRMDTMSLTEALVWCDENQLAAYLECCNADDLPFYKARGFKVVQMIQSADDVCSQLHSLWRMPRRVA